MGSADKSVDLEQYFSVEHVTVSQGKVLINSVPVADRYKMAAAAGQRWQAHACQCLLSKLNL